MADENLTNPGNFSSHKCNKDTEKKVSKSSCSSSEDEGPRCWPVTRACLLTHDTRSEAASWAADCQAEVWISTLILIHIQASYL